MKHYLTGLKNALLIRGILAILFGLFALFVPCSSLRIFIIVFACFAILDGVFSILLSLTRIKHEHSWWYLLLQGCLSLFVGALVLNSPFLTEILIVIYIAIWMIAIGVLEITTAVRIHRLIKGELLYVFSGIISILAGMMILYDPMGGIWVLSWLIGANSLLFGLIFMIMGWRLSVRVKTME